MARFPAGVYDGGPTTYSDQDVVDLMRLAVRVHHAAWGVYGDWSSDSNYSNRLQPWEGGKAYNELSRSRRYMAPHYAARDACEELDGLLYDAAFGDERMRISLNTADSGYADYCRRQASGWGRRRGRHESPVLTDSYVENVFALTTQLLDYMRQVGICTEGRANYLVGDRRREVASAQQSARELNPGQRIRALPQASTKGRDGHVW